MTRTILFGRVVPPQSNKLRRAAIAAVCAAACASVARGDTWTNSTGNGLWSDPLNWSNGRVPDQYTGVDLPATIPGSGVITLPDGAAAQQVVFYNGYTLTGGTLATDNLLNYHTGGAVGTINSTMVSTTNALYLNISPQSPILLAGANTFTAAINVSGSGTAGVRITSDASLGNINNAVTMYGLVEAAGTFASHRKYNLGTSYAGFSVLSGHTFTIATPLNAFGVFTKYGTGTLALTQAATQSDPNFPTGIDVDINEGVVSVGHGEALGIQHFNGVEVHQLGTLEVADASLVRNVTLDGGTLRGKGNGVVTGVVKVSHPSGSSLIVPRLSGGPLASDSLTIGDGPNDLTSANPGSQQRVNVEGAGRVVLPHANSAPFQWSVSGKLVVKHSGALGPASIVPITVGGGTLAAGGATIANPVHVTANGATFASAGAAGTVSGNVMLMAPGSTPINYALTGPGETTSADLTMAGSIPSASNMNLTNAAGQPAALNLTAPNGVLSGSMNVHTGAELASRPASLHGHSLGSMAVRLSGGALGFYANNSVTYTNVIQVGPLPPLPVVLPPARLKYAPGDATGTGQTLFTRVNIQAAQALHTEAAGDYRIRLADSTNAGHLVHDAGLLELAGTQQWSAHSRLTVKGGTVHINTDLGASGANATVDASAGETLVNETQRLAALNVAAGGRMAFGEHGARTLHTRSLAVAGELDMADNDFAVDYTGDSPEAAIRQRVIDARAAGATSGIFSRRGAVDDDVALAVADNAAWGKSELNGVAIDSTTVVGKYTYFGDANLDGTVTGDDYLNVDANLGTGDAWLEGDFNMSGQTTGDDYLAIDANLGKGTADPLAFAELKEEMVALHAAMFGEGYLVKLAQAEADGFGASVVPEPASIVVVALASISMMRRQRRR